MTTEKPRQLWILQDAIEDNVTDILTHEPTRHTVSDFVHVIERSYATKLEQDLDIRLNKYSALVDKYDALIDKKHQLAVENKRLREALRKIASYETLDGDKYVNYQEGWYGVAEFAAKALSGETKE